MLLALISEYKQSIKSRDTEEKIDLFFCRPFGFFIAKIANYFNMTPTMLSITGLILGLIASYFFYQDQTSFVFFSACACFLLSGVLDSADGQLARIANKSTPMGLILDGICDSLVTISIYFACARPYYSRFNYLFSLVIILSLVLHSFQCAILDFYHREYLYFGLGKTHGNVYWNPGVEEASINIKKSNGNFDKFLNYLRLDWIKKQQLISTRSEKERNKMKELLLSSEGNDKEEFMKSYRKHNLWLLPFWRLIGVNAHTALLIFFIFFGRFDIYLFGFDLFAFNFIIMIVRFMQKKSDRNLFVEIKIA